MPRFVTSLFIWKNTSPTSRGLRSPAHRRIQMMADKNRVHIPCGHLDTYNAMCLIPPYICPGCGEEMNLGDVMNVTPGATGISLRGEPPRKGHLEALAKWRRENEK